MHKFELVKCVCIAYYQIVVKLIFKSAKCRQFVCRQRANSMYQNFRSFYFVSSNCGHLQYTTF